MIFALSIVGNIENLVRSIAGNCDICREILEFVIMRQYNPGKNLHTSWEENFFPADPTEYYDPAEY